MVFTPQFIFATFVTLREEMQHSLWSLLAAHNAAGLAGESPAPAIDCLAG